jgi:diguanylate cyclase (GGDEF)-like protein/PAS domain S-box-containing protein
MTDRMELLEATLDSLPDGFALMGSNGKLAFWNRAASAITGYPVHELLGRSVRDVLEATIVGGARNWTHQTGAEPEPGHGSLVHVRHRLGHELPAMVRVLALHDGLGERIGMAALFHPAERRDALPHGDYAENAAAEATRAEIQDRLDAEFEDFARGHLPFGVLWITVDQAHELRRTHGASACEAMLEKVARVLAHGLRPGEEIGRWGDDEFLVISHERSAEMLADHAQSLAGLARTADFRWWGDRISLTASIGAAQAEQSDSLADLLERARGAMRTSIHAGGNHVTTSSGRLSCSPS